MLIFLFLFLSFSLKKEWFIDDRKKKWMWYIVKTEAQSLMSKKRKCFFLMKLYHLMWSGSGETQLVLQNRLIRKRTIFLYLNLKYFPTNAKRWIDHLSQPSSKPPHAFVCFSSWYFVLVIVVLVWYLELKVWFRCDGHCIAFSLLSGSRKSSGWSKPKSTISIFITNDCSQI